MYIQSAHVVAAITARDGSKVTPDRRRSQPPFLHLPSQVRRRECFPLHVEERDKLAAANSEGEFDSVVEHSDAGADADGGDGM